MIVLVMGTTGSGKTTIGQMLAKRLGWLFLDADDFHSASNKEKMHRGIPSDGRGSRAVASGYPRGTGAPKRLATKRGTGVLSIEAGVSRGIARAT